MKKTIPQKKKLPDQIPKKKKKTGIEHPEEAYVYPQIFPDPSTNLSSEVVNNELKGIFGYEFRGFKLVNSQTLEPYQFSSNYESLCTYVSVFIQCLMKEHFGLMEHWIPPQSPSVNIFLSGDFYTNTSTLMVIIQGRGEVRAGQWSRKVCVNENITEGSNLPYIESAINKAYSLIVLNPNLNKDFNGNDIPYNSSMIEHCQYVWENFVLRSPAKKIVIVAHSCGGVCALHLIKSFFKDFLTRVKAIALLDSVHKTVTELTEEQKKYFEKTAQNWKKSKKKLGMNVAPGRNEGCACLSAGDERHEYTSGKAFPQIFPFLESKLGSKRI